MLAVGCITMVEVYYSTGRGVRGKDMLGLFENPYVDETLESKVVHCKEHQDKALEIAQKTVVLLKNENNMLPLSRSIRKIAVLGPNANLPVMGDYCMEPDYHAVTLLEGIREVLGVPAENVETTANATKTEIDYDKCCNILGAEI